MINGCEKLSNIRVRIAKITIRARINAVTIATINSLLLSVSPPISNAIPAGKLYDSANF